MIELENTLDDLCTRRGWEWRLECSTGTQCAWEATLTVVLTPGNPDGPDRSLVTFAGGGAGPDDAATKVFTGMLDWLPDVAPAGPEVPT